VAFKQANLSGNGDAFNLGFSVTEGSNQLLTSYTYPINPRDGTVGLTFSYTSSDVIEEPFDRLDLESSSPYVELTWRQPIIKNLNQELALGLSFTYQHTEVTIEDIPIRLSPGADANGETNVSALRFFQEWTQRNSREIFAARSQFNFGIDIFNATINDSDPDGTFFDWRGQLQWARLLASDTLLLLRGDVQLASDPLVSLEQFRIGGQDSLRGYRQDVFLTDNGLLASAEVRLPILRIPKWNTLLQIAPFVDFGVAWNNSDSPRRTPNPNTLVSVGLGLQLQVSDRLTARFDWGIPLVDVDAPDRTAQENGIYFSVVLSPF
ncbi:MAG: ShlB/FhaC/HecB family hemolysin secretion/activation protein, partial [Moorea sp. SIO2B7]|nr:ShlB/FhaC/HecB family hemolysin secretion/activation protein [Moorena sp. SIO2B7]